jgi:hypothetical protein
VSRRALVCHVKTLRPKVLAIPNERYNRRLGWLWRYPKEQFQTEVDSWRHVQSQNFEFTMKRLREPIEGGG